MHIMNIPCRIVYELPMPENILNLTPNRTMTRKRCGIKFKPVNSHHQKQLECFLTQYIHNPISTQN
jgi:hypothetical protein